MIPKDSEDKDMHIGARPIIFKRAKELRERMTPSEALLWEELRNKKLEGYKFRRQHPILKYILDFYCHKFKLVIEVDGGIHSILCQKEIDKLREKELINNGLSILRFSNEKVTNNMEQVKRAIINKIKELESKATLPPSP